MNAPQQNDTFLGKLGAREGKKAPKAPNAEIAVVVLIVAASWLNLLRIVL